MMSYCGLDDVRDLIEERMRILESDSLTLDDFTSAPHSDARYPSELIAEAQVRGVYDQIVYRSEQEQKAIVFKRQGNLCKANELYIDIFRKEKRFDKPYIWSWCKVLILAKNFSDLFLLLKYLHHFNARFNLLSLPHNPDLSAYEAFGSTQELDFSFDAAQYLREICGDPLDSKERVEWRFRQYGGSELWDNNYQLSMGEYEDFCTYFGTQEMKGRQNGLGDEGRNLRSANSSSVGGSGSSGSGCYIATYVYGSYDCPEVWALRRFRDNWLAKFPAGRLFIRCYYALSPRLISLVGDSKVFRGLAKHCTDCLVKRVNSAGYGDEPYFGA